MKKKFKEKCLSYMIAQWNSSKRMLYYNYNQILSSQKYNRTAYIGWLGFNNLGDEILFKAHQKLFPTLQMER